MIHLSQMKMQDVLEYCVIPHISCPRQLFRVCIALCNLGKFKELLKSRKDIAMSMSRIPSLSATNIAEYSDTLIFRYLYPRHIMSMLSLSAAIEGPFMGYDSPFIDEYVVPYLSNNPYQIFFWNRILRSCSLTHREMLKYRHTTPDFLEILIRYHNVSERFIEEHFDLKDRRVLGTVIRTMRKMSFRFRKKHVPFTRVYVKYVEKETHYSVRKKYENSSTLERRVLIRYSKTVPDDIVIDYFTQYPNDYALLANPSISRGIVLALEPRAPSREYILSVIDRGDMPLYLLERHMNLLSEFEILCHINKFTVTIEFLKRNSNRICNSEAWISRVICTDATVEVVQYLCDRDTSNKVSSYQRGQGTLGFCSHYLA